jgi:hypothetical protein
MPKVHPDERPPRKGDAMSTENGTPVEQALARFLDGEPEPGDAAVLTTAMETDPAFADQVRRLLVLDDLLRQEAEPDPAAFTEAVQIRLAAEGDSDCFTQAIRDRLTAEAGVQGAAPNLVPAPAEARPAPRRFPWSGPWWVLAGSAAVVLAGLLWWVAGGGTDRGQTGEIAWVTNAQNCRWGEGGAPAGDMVTGKRLHLEQGLVELGFHNGVSLVLRGPATLELQSERRVLLLSGSLVAKVPEAGRGFEVLSVQGKVVDLGTEFGVSIGADNSVQVAVFRGEVQARSAGTLPGEAPVSIREHQSARMSGNRVALQPEGPEPDSFVRAIVPPPVIVPRTLVLDFRHAVEGSLQDAAGLGTGLTQRLPGTGERLPAHDPHLRLNLDKGRLELTTTENDLNGRYKLFQGEYPGVRLADLGFTGKEDFAVTTVIANIPSLETVDQVGLYAGVRSDRNIRGGLLRPGEQKGEGPARQFFVHNNGGKDSHLSMVGLVSIGADLRLTLQRIGGKYSLRSENQTTGESCILINRHPDFLDGENDLLVGLFGATPWRDKPRTIFVKEFKATVWTFELKENR